jgi:two-component system phosphate regulon sensor histidine kinase PhoR
LINSPENEYWYGLLDNLLEGIWIENPAGEITFVNARLQSMCGYDTPDELTGKRHDVLTTLEEHRLVESLDNVESRFTCETLLRSRSGSSFVVLLGMTPLIGKGQYLGRLYSVIDLRDKKRLENEIRRSVNRFRDFIENTIDGICIVEDSYLRLFNRRLEEMSGYGREELRRITFPTLIAAQDQALLAETLDAERKFLLPVNHELRLLTKDGRELDVELRMVPIEYEGRSSLLCFLRDITSKKELEKMKTEFVAMLSHELRTPLAMIKEAVSLLNEGSGLKLEGPPLRFLTIAQDEINRLNRMIDNLLEISRMESVEMRLRIAPVRIGEIIDRVLNTLQVPVSQKRMNIVKTMPDGQLTIHADEDRLIQVLTNLLDNAVKFSPDGSTITITAEKLDPEAPILAAHNVAPSDSYLKLSVSDNGLGIPAEHLERIFRKYERVNQGGVPGPKGIGLGLAIAKNIVEMHGGRIWARSEDGKGSEFVVILPSRPSIAR